GTHFNPKRGAQVVSWAATFLDEAFPLTQGSHADARAYAVADGKLAVTLTSGATVALAYAAQFVGYNGATDAPRAILLVNNGLHVEIQIDADDPIGRDHAAGVKDVLMEAAVT